MNYIFDFFLNTFCNLLDYVTGCDSHSFNREILKKNEELTLIKNKLKQTKDILDYSHNSLINEINLTNEYHSETINQFEIKRKSYNEKWNILSRELISLCESVDTFTNEMNEKCNRIIMKNQLIDIMADEIFSEKICSNIDHFRKYDKSSVIDEIFEINRYLSVSANNKGDIKKILDNQKMLNLEYDEVRFKREIKKQWDKGIYIDKNEIKIRNFLNKFNTL